MNSLRNVAIIAHVDHGKTTLVDALLRQTNTALHKDLVDQDLIMDSNDLEKERGITIFSKNASVIWEGTKINIIDTPGHADFGGEVERVLNRADGCLLLVDAKEGPMPQTRFVLKRALEMGHKIIVVINKVDKSTLREPDGSLKVDQAAIDKVLNKTFDLFVELGADEETAFFPVIFASAKNGLAAENSDLSQMTDITPVFKAIVTHLPAPSGNPDLPLQMLVTNISSDNYKGRIATGRIYNGALKNGQEISHIDRNGLVKKAKITSLMSFAGLNRVEVSQAEAGDIVALAGIADVNIGETVADGSDPKPLPLLDIDEPTIRMTFSVNSSPFAGREGEFKTSRQIRERLYKELETDTALRVEDGDNGDPASPGASQGGWVVSGRGELHLAIFIERLRREGYEFQVSRPQVINKTVDGQKMTPFERVFIEIPEEYAGTVMQKMGLRHAQMEEMRVENGVQFLTFIIATKEFFGYRSEFLTDSRGTGIINTLFYQFAPDNGTTFQRERGSLIAHESGTTTMHGLINAQERGTLFLEAAVPVYQGQVIGQNARGDDMRVNVCKEKKLTNHRSRGEGVGEHFDAPKVMTLEDALEYIDDTELVEITPKTIRIRKIAFS